MAIRRIPTGAPPIDDLLGGGLEAGILTEFYGEPGTGKSTLAILASLSVASSGGKVFFVDTEGMSPERLAQLARGLDPSVLERISILRVWAFDEQEEAVNRAIEASPDLIVIDTLTGLFRLEFGDSVEQVRSLAKQLARLVRAAGRADIPVLFTNQVHVDTRTGEVRAVGGHLVEHAAKCIVRLRKLDELREAVLEKHRSMRSGRSVVFRITESGIEPP